MAEVKKFLFNVDFDDENENENEEEDFFEGVYEDQNLESKEEKELVDDRIDDVQDIVDEQLDKLQSKDEESEQEPDPEPQPEPNQVPKYNQIQLDEQIKQAKEMGLAEGETIGQQKALEGIEEQTRIQKEKISASLENITNQFQTLKQEQEKQIEDVKEKSVELSSLILEKMLPTLQKKQAKQEVLDIIEQTFPMLIDETRVIIKLAPEMAEKIKKQCHIIANEQGFEGRLIITKDKNMQENDCVVEWKGGGIEKNTEETWQQIKEIIEKIQNNKP